MRPRGRASGQVHDWLGARLELGRGGSAGNLRPMEGLRGFAVLLVFFVHFTTLVDPWVPAHSPTHAVAGVLHTLGNTGVDLFFVLSGYLIYGSLVSRPQPLRSFLARRVERIYPAFLAVFALYLLLCWVRPESSKLPAGLLDATVYVVQNLLLLPGLLPLEPLIAVAWSLSFEMAFYLALPLLVGALQLRRRSPAARAGFFGLASFASLALAEQLGDYVRMTMFLSGILLFESLASRRLRAPPAALACLVLALAWAVRVLPLAAGWGSPVKVALLFAAFGLLCAACLLEPGGRLGRCFSWTPLRWLGNMSYSFFLLHGLVLHGAVFVLARVHPPSVQSGGAEFWVLLLPLFALCLVASLVLFLAVERPWSLAGKGRAG